MDILGEGQGWGMGNGKRSQEEGVPRQGIVDQLHLSRDRHALGLYQCMMAPRGLKECDFPVRKEAYILVRELCPGQAFKRQN